MPSAVASAFTVLVLSHHPVEACALLLLPDLDQVAIGALHQAVEHLHHVQARTEREYTVPISRPMMPPPITSILGHARERQGAGGVDDARVIGQERQMHRLRPAR
jgi:hypothetical protein